LRLPLSIGNTRTTPFVVRALNKMEFDEWLRSLYYVLKRLRFELVPTPTEIILQPNKHNLDSDRAAQSAGRDGTDDEGSEDSAGEYEPSTSTAHADAAATAAATPPTQSASTAHAAAAAVAANAPPPEPHAQKDYVAMEFYYQDVDGPRPRRTGKPGQPNPERPVR
jgi:cell division septation protein DedD